jgi:hypothetical protein
MADVGLEGEVSAEICSARDVLVIAGSIVVAVDASGLKDLLERIQFGELVQRVPEREALRPCFHFSSSLGVSEDCRSLRQRLALAEQLLLLKQDRRAQ